MNSLCWTTGPLGLHRTVRLKRVLAWLRQLTLLWKLVSLRRREQALTKQLSPQTKQALSNAPKRSCYVKQVAYSALQQRCSKRIIHSYLWIKWVDQTLNALLEQQMVDRHHAPSLLLKVWSWRHLQRHPTSTQDKDKSLIQLTRPYLDGLWVLLNRIRARRQWALLERHVDLSLGIEHL